MAKKVQTKDITGFDTESENDFLVRGKNWLLIIAINDYKVKPLHNCVADAEALRDVLQERYTFEKSETKEWKNTDATRSKIINEFIDLIDNKIEENDNVVIYYSGHGIDHRILGFSWIPIEGEPKEGEAGDASLFIRQADILPLLNALDEKKVRHIFMLVDSCFSGTMFNQIKSGTALAESVESEPSRWGLSSGRRELVSDGEPGDHSPFAKSVITVLKENTGPLPVSILGHRVIQRVKEIEESAQTPRFDRLKVGGDAGGEMVFHLRESVKVPSKSKGNFVQPDVVLSLPIQAEIGYPAVPFKGLHWFEKEDARIFFGRRKEISNVFQLLDNQYSNSERLLLLHGPSGTGKSSFLFAGLLPCLPQDWAVLYQRRGQHGNAIEIIKKGERLVSTKKSVLILDQMEEIFSNPGQDGLFETAHFNQTLTNVLRHNPNLTVVLSFREEYLGRICNLLNQPSDAYTLITINYLDRAGIYEALTGVAQEAQEHFRGLTYEDPDLPREIANDFLVLDAKTYTPLIQYVLRRMWDEVAMQPAENDPVKFTRALYKRMYRASLKELLDTQLDGVGKTFQKDLENGLLNDLLYTFVTEEVTACSQSLTDLFEAYHHLPAEHLLSVCKTLEENYLLTSFSDKDGVLHYRLCHDALAPFVVRRYRESEAVGQKASRFLEQALRTRITLSKAATLTIDTGTNGRKAPNNAEIEEIRKGWKRNIKSIVRDEVGENEIENAAILLQKYLDMFNLGHEGILIQARFNNLMREYRRGKLSKKYFAEEKRKIEKDILFYVGNIDIEQRKIYLLLIISSIISGNSKKILNNIVNFIENEEPESVVFFQQIKAALIELESKLRRYVLSTEEYLHQHSKLIHSLVYEILKEWSEGFGGDTVLLSSQDIKDIAYKDLFKLFYAHDTTKDSVLSVTSAEVGVEDKVLNQEYIDQILGDLSRLSKLITAANLSNWISRSIKQDIISATDSSIALNHLQNSLQILHTPSTALNITGQDIEGNDLLFFLLDLIYKDQLENVLNFLIQRNLLAAGLEAKIILDKITEDQIDLGLYLIEFDEYRIRRNIFCHSIVSALDEKHHFIYKDDAKTIEHEMLYKEIAKKINAGMLSESFGSLGSIMQQNISLDLFSNLIMAASIEHDIKSRLQKGCISIGDYNIWENRIREILKGVLEELYGSDLFLNDIENEDYKIPENISVTDVRKLLASGNYLLSLIYLTHLLSNLGDVERSDIIIILQNQSYTLENRMKTGVLRPGEYNLERNRIVGAILDITNEIETSPSQKPITNTPVPITPPSTP